MANSATQTFINVEVFNTIRSHPTPDRRIKIPIISGQTLAYALMQSQVWTELSTAHRSMNPVCFRFSNEDADVDTTTELQTFLGTNVVKAYRRTLMEPPSSPRHVRRGASAGSTGENDDSFTPPPSSAAPNRAESRASMRGEPNDTSSSSPRTTAQVSHLCTAQAHVHNNSRVSAPLNTVINRSCDAMDQDQGSIQGPSASPASKRQTSAAHSQYADGRSDNSGLLENFPHSERLESLFRIPDQDSLETRLRASAQGFEPAADRVLVVVPMVEEATYIRSFFNREHFSHRSEVGFSCYSRDDCYDVFVMVVGQMTNLPTQAGVADAILCIKPKTAVLIGIAGSLDVEACPIGSVIIPPQVTKVDIVKMEDVGGSEPSRIERNELSITVTITIRFTPRARAVPDATHRRVATRLMEVVDDFRTFAALERPNLDALSAIENEDDEREAVAEVWDPEETRSAICTTRPMACGDAVVKSKVWQNAIKAGVGSDLAAVAMEDSGFLSAAEAFNVDRTIIRGISDGAGKFKKYHDSVGGGNNKSLREWAVWNAAYVALRTVFIKD